VSIPFGSSPRTETAASLHCMSGTKAPTNTGTGGCAACLRDREKKSSFVTEPDQPDLFGDLSSVTAESEESTAPSSVMRVRSNRPSLSDRLTLSLIKHGLVAGTTPTSIRKRCGAPIPATVFWLPDGGDVG